MVSIITQDWTPQENENGRWWERICDGYRLVVVGPDGNYLALHVRHGTGAVTALGEAATIREAQAIADERGRNHQTRGG